MSTVQPPGPGYRCGKRAVDVVGASLLLGILSPVAALAALMIRRFSPGPVLFCQEREGVGGTSFRLFKLRTMCIDADDVLRRHVDSDPAAAEEWARYRRIGGDPRVAGPVARLARRYSVDEVPQLWNVIRGDMSLVGPRPLEIDVAAGLPAEYRRRRASVRPGLTGLWQVSGRSHFDIEGMRGFDATYLAGRSLGLDLRILARTPASVLTARGAY